ncbi:MAG: phosphatidylserine decarboxylase [Planctomycetota bacterium]
MRQRRPIFDQLRDALPVARWGFYELLVVFVVVLAAAAAIGVQGLPWAAAAVVPLALAGAAAWFYRDPRRSVPDDPAVYLAPADGTVVAIDSLDDNADEEEKGHLDGCGFFTGPAVRVGIFLSVFDVHINRCPHAGRVAKVEYRRGEHRDARSPESVQRNESNWIGFEDERGGRFAVRQVSGAVARRIACDLAPGQPVRAGEKFGMIKLGSRTELTLPAGAEVLCRVGDKVRGGQTVLARVAGGPL